MKFGGAMPAIHQTVTVASGICFDNLDAVK